MQSHLGLSLVLTLGFVLVEAMAGYLASSLALLAGAAQLVHDAMLYTNFCSPLPPAQQIWRAAAPSP